MAAFEDFDFFQKATSRAPTVTRRGEASPSRDALRSELERLHFELRVMRKTLDRHQRWRERLRRWVGFVVPGSVPARRMRDSA